MFLLYKVNHTDSTLCFTGIFEMEVDAKEEMKRLTQDYTPDETLKQTFKIEEIPYTSTEEYNKESPPMKYNEEDYDGDEENDDVQEELIHNNQNNIISNAFVQELISKNPDKIVIYRIETYDDSVLIYSLAMFGIFIIMLNLFLYYYRPS